MRIPIFVLKTRHMNYEEVSAQAIKKGPEDPFLYNL